MMPESQFPAPTDPSPLTKLGQQMVDVFTLDEVCTLCIDLNVNFDELPHPGLMPKIRSLIQLMIENGRLQELVTAVSHTRPHLNWPSLTDLEAGTWPASELELAPPQTVVSAHDEGATVVGPRGVYVVGDVYGNIVTGDTYNYYIEGTHFYLPDFTTAVKNFLYNYLGDETHHVPFGGRDDAIKELEQWRTNADSPPRLLLTAPAGRGKSALLVQWSAYLRTKQDVAVVFMPISIRFNTNQETDTFSLLAIRLAHLYGKKIPAKWGDFPASAWRKLVAEYLQEPLPDGRHLLLIMDGLDEAAWQPSADLFPHQLPDRVRLVISARYRGGEDPGPEPWLRLLDWDKYPQIAATLELEVLTQTGVRDVLEKMGCPLDDLSQKVDIVTELYRLSEGDPLLVELYVKDLWQQGEAITRLKPQDLHEIRPGYDGYFDKWWADQEKLWGQGDLPEMDLVDDLLDILTIAKGPLQINDLLQLLQGKVRSRDISRAMHSLNRYIVGNGKEQGYIFSHPKLGNHFQNKLEKQELTSLQQKYLVWGKQTLTRLQLNQIDPIDVSRYLVLYYSRHLEDSKALVEDFLLLISKEWLQACHVKTGTYAAFLQDVNLAWKKIKKINKEMILEGSPPAYLGQEILCALCHASVNNLARNLPNKLLVLLLEHNIWTEEQVLTYARMKRKTEERNELFKLLIPKISIKSQKSLLQIITSRVGFYYRDFDVICCMVPYIPQDILRLTKLIVLPESAFELLSYVLPYLENDQREEVLEKALTEVNQNWYVPNSVKMLNSLMPHLSREQKQTALLEILDRVLATKAIGIQSQVESLLGLLPHLSAEDQSVTIGKIQDFIDQIESTVDRAGFQAELLEFLEPMSRQQMLEKVLTITKSIHSENSKRYLLLKMVPHIPHEILIETLKIKDDLFKQDLLVALIPHVPKDVLQSISSINEKRIREKVLVELSTALPEPVFEEAVQTKSAEVLVSLAPHLPQKVLIEANNWVNKSEQALIFLSLVPHFPRKRQKAVVNKALKAMQLINHNVIKAELITEAILLTKPSKQKEMIEEALKLARSIDDEYSKKTLLISLSEHVPELVIQTIDILQSDVHKVEVLVRLAPYLPQEVFSEIELFEDDWYKELILVSLAPFIPELVYSESDTIESETNKSVTLASLTPYYPEKIVQSLDLISEEWNRVRIMCELASYFPDVIHGLLSSIHSEYAKATVLGKLLAHLSTEKKEQILIQSTQIFQNIQYLPGRAELFNEWWKSLNNEERKFLIPIYDLTIQDCTDDSILIEVLKIFASLMPESVFEHVANIENEIQKAEVLAVLAEELPEIVFETINTFQNESAKCVVLASLASYFPDFIFDLSHSIKNNGSKYEVLKALAPIIPRKLITFVGTLEKDFYRAALLSYLLPFLPLNQKFSALQEIIDRTSSFHLEESRADDFSRISEQIISLPKKEVYTLFHMSILGTGLDSRNDLLSDVSSLTQVIHYLGGHSSLKTIVDAVIEVSEWWP